MIAEVILSAIALCTPVWCPLVWRWWCNQRQRDVQVYTRRHRPRL